MKFALFLTASFFLGSIPTAYLMVLKVKGVDIRRHGSGNVGATNAFRVMGKKYGALVFFIDFLKGLIPAWIAQSYYSGVAQAPILALAVGVAAILGHIFTPFLGFKGGKGVATGAGALCGVYPWLFLYIFLVWILAFLTTRLVSLSSLLAMAVLVPISFWYRQDKAITGVFFGLFLLIGWTHRDNIIRLLQRKEERITKNS